MWSLKAHTRNSAFTHVEIDTVDGNQMDTFHSGGTCNHAKRVCLGRDENSL